MRRRLRGFDGVNDDEDDWPDAVPASGINIVARQVTVVTTKPRGNERRDRRNPPFFAIRSRKNDEILARDWDESCMDHESRTKFRNGGEYDSDELPPGVTPGRSTSDQQALSQCVHQPRPCCSHRRWYPSMDSSPSGPSQSSPCPYVSMAVSSNTPHTIPSTAPSTITPAPAMAVATPPSSAPAALTKSDIPISILDSTFCKTDMCCPKIDVASSQGTRPSVQYQVCPGVNSSRTYLVVPLRLRRGGDDIVVRTAGAVARSVSAGTAIVVRQQRQSHSSHHTRQDRPTSVVQLEESQPPISTPTEPPPVSPPAPPTPILRYVDKTPLTGGPGKVYGYQMLSTLCSSGEQPLEPAGISPLPLIMLDTPPVSPIKSDPNTPLPKETPQTKAVKEVQGVKVVKEVKELTTVGTQYSDHSDIDIKCEKKELTEDTRISGTRSTTKNIHPRLIPMNTKVHTQFTVANRKEVSDPSQGMKIPTDDSESTSTGNESPLAMPCVNVSIRLAGGRDVRVLGKQYDGDTFLTQSDELTPSMGQVFEATKEELNPLAVALRDAFRMCSQLNMVPDKPFILTAKDQDKAPESTHQSVERCAMGGGDVSEYQAAKTIEQASETLKSLLAQREPQKDELQQLNNGDQMNQSQNEDVQENLQHSQKPKLKHLVKSNYLQLQQQRRQEQQLKFQQIKQQQLKQAEEFNSRLQENQQRSQLQQQQQIKKQQGQARLLKQCDQTKQKEQSMKRNEETKQSESVKKQEHPKDVEESNQKVQQSKEHASRKEQHHQQRRRSGKSPSPKHHMTKEQEQSKQPLESKETKHSAEPLTNADIKPQTKYREVEIKISKKEDVNHDWLNQRERSNEKQIQLKNKEQVKVQEHLKEQTMAETKVEAIQKSSATSISPSQSKETLGPDSERKHHNSRSSSPSRPPTPYYPWGNTKRLDVSPAHPVRPRIPLNQKESSTIKLTSDPSDIICEKDSSIIDLNSEHSSAGGGNTSIKNEEIIVKPKAIIPTPQLLRQRLQPLLMRHTTMSLSVERREQQWVPTSSVGDALNQQSLKLTDGGNNNISAPLKLLQSSLPRISRPSSEKSHTPKTPSSRLNSLTTSSLLTSSLLHGKSTEHLYRRFSPAHWPTPLVSEIHSRVQSSAEQLVKSFSRDITMSSSSISSECLINRPSLDLIPSRRLTPTGLPSQLSVARSLSCEMIQISTERLVREISQELGSLPPSTESIPTRISSLRGKKCSTSQGDSTDSKKQSRKNHKRPSKLSRPLTRGKGKRGLGAVPPRRQPQLRWLLPPTPTRTRQTPASPSAPARLTPRTVVRPAATRSKRRSLTGQQQRQANSSPAMEKQAVQQSTLRLLPQTGNNKWSLREVTTTTMSGNRSGRAAGSRNSVQRGARGSLAINRSARLRSQSQPFVDRTKERPSPARSSIGCRSPARQAPTTTSAPSPGRWVPQRLPSSDRAVAGQTLRAAARLNTLHEEKNSLCRGSERGSSELSKELLSRLSNNKCFIPFMDLNRPLPSKTESNSTQSTSNFDSNKFPVVRSNTDNSQPQIPAKKGFKRPQDLISQIMIEASAAANANSFVRCRSKRKEKESENEKEKSDDTDEKEKLQLLERSSASKSIMTSSDETSGSEFPVQVPTPLQIPGLANKARTEAQKLLQELIHRNREREIRTTSNSTSAL